MDLKEFIKTSVSQISEAIVELNGGRQDFPLTVNPVATSMEKGVHIYNHKGWFCHVSELRFHVAVTEARSQENGVGASIKVLGIKQKNGREDENLTTIDFPVFVVFPTIKTDPTVH